MEQRQLVSTVRHEADQGQYCMNFAAEGCDCSWLILHAVSAGGQQ